MKPRFTLIELLVVTAIIATASFPAVSHGGDGRRLRNGERV